MLVSARPLLVVVRWCPRTRRLYSSSNSYEFHYWLLGLGSLQLSCTRIQPQRLAPQVVREAHLYSGSFVPCPGAYCAHVYVSVRTFPRVGQARVAVAL